MKNVLKKFKKVYKTAVKNSFFTWILGFAIGALTSIYPIPLFIVFVFITLIILIIISTDTIKSEKDVKIDSFEEQLRKPDPHAQNRINVEGESLLVVGQSIEICPHPKLNKQSKMCDLGWELSDVLIQDEQRSFDTNYICRDVDIINDNKIINDGDKYSIVEINGGLSDAPNLVLKIRHTKFSTIMSVQQSIKEDITLRERYGSIDPKENKIPHSLCLHYIVRFADGNILCQKRDSRLAYYPNSWSFSGEEQLSELDLESTNKMESLFRRAFCEEVLPLMGNEVDEDIWSYAKEIIKEMRMWSIFIEERMFNYSLLGFYQLNCTKEDYKNYFNELITKSIGIKEREGKLYIIKEKELKKLLYEGEGTVENIFNEEEIIVVEEDLHPTSRYRIYRLLKAISRGALTKNYFT